MKMKVMVCAGVLFAVITQLALGQVLAQPPGKRGKRERLIIPYPPLREADVMWEKRIWRTMDLREKVNHPYYYPLVPAQERMSLFDVLKTEIREGRVTAYGNPVIDDGFTVPLSRSEAEAIFVRYDTLMIDPIEGGEPEPKAIKREVMASDIRQYWIKEDWFFDRQRSVMDVRIVGICPLKENVGDDGEVRGYQPMFWVYFPEIRQCLMDQDVYVTPNASMPLSFDDLFMKRYFSSFIHKESNVYDRSIAEYKSGIDALLEAERVKEDLLFYEHDLWHY